MNPSIVGIITCLTFGQVATQTSLATRFDAVVRSMMPEWVADADPVGTRHTRPANEERFRWHKPAEQGPGLIVEVLTYESADAAEWQLRQTLSGLSIGGPEIQGVGDHAVHVVMPGRSVSPWMGTVTDLAAWRPAAGVCIAALCGTGSGALWWAMTGATETIWLPMTWGTMFCLLAVWFFAEVLRRLGPPQR